LICREAFKPVDLKKIAHFFKKVIEIPFSEAKTSFALNAHCIINDKTGERRAIIQKGAFETIKALKEAGFEVIEIDTSEFMKSGGSVFCMKMMYY